MSGPPPPKTKTPEEADREADKTSREVAESALREPLKPKAPPFRSAYPTLGQAYGKKGGRSHYRKTRRSRTKKSRTKRSRTKKSRRRGGASCSKI